MKLKVFSRDPTAVEDIINGQIADLEKSGMLNFDVDPRKDFHLDASKIAFHSERVDAWQRGERVAPITIDMALTQKCSYSCTFCYAGLQQNPSAPVPWEAYENFLDDCVTIGHKPGEGVRAISLVSDGESTENPYIYKFIAKANENGIDIALGTNGLKIDKEEMPGLVDALTYLRINFDAGEPEAYSEIMGTAAKNYHKVIENVKELVRLKQERNSDVTIGLQMVLMPEYADQVIPLALLGRDLGVDYTVIKHCSDDEKGSLGVDYGWYTGEQATKLLETAEALSTEDYSVQVKWSKIKTGRDRSYSKCFGTPLHLQFSGSGIVAPCGSFFHNDYKDFHIGDLKTQRFKDIWESDAYWKITGHLKSDEFNPQYMCETLCLQDKTNEILYDIVVKGGSLQDVSDKKRPMHVNFI